MKIAAAAAFLWALPAAEAAPPGGESQVNVAEGYLSGAPENAAGANGAERSNAEAAPDPVGLSQTIAMLESDDIGTVCEALASMARLCDHRCVPYISDALRHHEPRVARQAAAVARVLSHPRLLPALEWVIWHHHDDEVRLEALRTAIAVILSQDNGRSDADLYRALFDALRIDRLDELLRKLMRSLPDALRGAYAETFADLARDASFASSAAAAYRDDPKPLFDALMRRIAQAPGGNDAKQLLRCARLLTEQNGNFKPDAASYEVLSLLPDAYFGDVAAVMASLSAPEAALWIVSHLPNLTKPTLLAVFGKMHGDAAEIVMQAVLDALASPQATPESVTWAAHIAPYEELAVAFIEKIPAHATPEICAFADSIAQNGNPAYLRAAMHLFGAFSSDPAARARVISWMGHSDAGIAYGAMRAAGADIRYWDELVAAVRDDFGGDAWGKALLARYALVRLANREAAAGGISANRAAEAVELARKTLADPARLHALPALWLLRALNAEIDLPSVEEFRRLRPEMQHAYLAAIAAQNAQNSHNGAEQSQVFADRETQSGRQTRANAENAGDRAFALMRAALSAPQNVRCGLSKTDRAGETASDSADCRAKSDRYAAAGALWMLSQAPQFCPIAAQDAELAAQIAQCVASPDQMIGSHAARAVSKCGWTQYIGALTDRLTDPDPVIAYSAIMALQTLRALPDAHWLKVLYYRSPRGFIRDRLAFLAGFGAKKNDQTSAAAPIADGSQNRRIFDLDSGTPLTPGQIVQISSAERIRSGEIIRIALPDQTIGIFQTNESGFFFVPE